MPPLPSTQETLSPHHAFVVQFRSNTDLTLGQFQGRVEHVLSGRATTFTSFEELAAFMVQLVADLQHAAAEDRPWPCGSDCESPRGAVALGGGWRSGKGRRQSNGQNG